MLCGLALLAAGLAVTTSLERKRLAATLPAAAAPEARLDGAAILDDLRSLASPAMQGRRTGTPGGLRARAFLAGRFRQAGLLPFGAGYLMRFSFVHRSLRALWRRDRPFRMSFPDAANVLGYVRGREQPDSYLVLSAHYDHLGIRGGAVYPGADDNASGVAALLGEARFLAAHPPRHSVILAAFDAEELGLRGARAFLERPPVPLERLAFELNLDMLSRSADRSIVVAGTGPRPRLAPLVAWAAARSAVRVRLGHDRPASRGGLVQDWSTASDHGPFRDRGIPWLYLGVEDHEDYHRPGDSVDKIDTSFFLRVAELVRNLVEGLDQAPRTLLP